MFVCNHYFITSSSSFFIFIAECRRPRNDAPVLFSSSCLLLLSCTPPESCQSNLLYRLPIVSLSFLCLFCRPDDLQKCTCSGSVLWSCAQSTVISAFSQCLWRSRSSRIHWSRDPSNWFAAYVCGMSSRKLSAITWFRSLIRLFVVYITWNSTPWLFYHWQNAVASDWPASPIALYAAYMYMRWKFTE